MGGGWGGGGGGVEMEELHVLFSGIVHIFMVIFSRFLRILQLLVQDPVGTETTCFLPSIISFTMKQIYPTISEKPVPDIKMVFYELLYLLLLNNWRSV